MALREACRELPGGWRRVSLNRDGGPGLRQREPLRREMLAAVRGRSP